jgi:hypothetical protein
MDPLDLNPKSRGHLASISLCCGGRRWYPPKFRSTCIVNSVDIGSGFSSLQTQVDSLIEYITNVGFRVFSLSANTISSANNLAYNVKDFDYTENGYNTTTFTYTISLAGTYIFTLGVYSILNTAFEVKLIRKTGLVQTVIQQVTHGTNTGNTLLIF